jgi:hypothetical protein
MSEYEAESSQLAYLFKYGSSLFPLLTYTVLFPGK